MCRYLLTSALCVRRRDCRYQRRRHPSIFRRVKPPQLKLLLLRSSATRARCLLFFFFFFLMFNGGWHPAVYIGIHHYPTFTSELPPLTSRRSPDQTQTTSELRSPAPLGAHLTNHRQLPSCEAPPRQALACVQLSVLVNL